MSEDDADEGSAAYRACEMSGINDSYRYDSTRNADRNVPEWDNPLHPENWDPSTCRMNLDVEDLDSSDYNDDVSETGDRFANKNLFFLIKGHLLRGTCTLSPPGHAGQS